MPARAEIASFIASLNAQYARLHTAKEELFWQTKMGMSADYDAFNAAEAVLQSFRQNVAHLHECRDLLKSDAIDAAQTETLNGWVHFFEANVIESEPARKLAQEIVERESALQQSRGRMALGYRDPDSGGHRPASSVELSLKIGTADREALRKACFQGLESIERHVLANGFLDIVRERNRFARQLGFEDYYDWKVSSTEGFGKRKLFELLDDLEARTRDAGRRYVDSIAAQHGRDALKPWNFRFTTQGSAIRDLDPYMQFDDALLRWGRGFTALGIRFETAELQLDLIVRKGKYENGFCHAPIVPYEDSAGRARAKVNFTSNAVPGQLGSGNRAAETLFHEGGHAAHFSNILMGAPCFSQEFAPTSASFAETQSMFCDSLLEDADWLVRYAKSRAGETIPWDVVERYTRLTHPAKVVFIRNLLVICYAEKALYELSEAELTPERVMQEFIDIERRLCFLDRCPRPTLAVPHLLSGEAACIYQGYVLAQAGVAQTRHYFTDAYGYLTDNPAIGPRLRDAYWRPGNSLPFMKFLARLTGKPFSMDALANDVAEPVEDAVASQRRKYEEGRQRPEFSGAVELDATIRMVHGAETIATTATGSFERMADVYRAWVAALPPVR
ncbi:MAG: peptidase M3 [Myxococcales bacterium]|nr:MAG: peptidase M3 [Myxococcales bacterium]